jgi:uncharacterized phage infection (PIP) family protein YhgE
MENVVKFLKQRMTWLGIAVVFIITTFLAFANLGSSTNPIPIKILGLFENTQTDKRKC